MRVWGSRVPGGRSGSRRLEISGEDDVRMNTLRRLLGATLTLCLALSAASCSKDQDPAAAPGPSTARTAEATPTTPPHGAYTDKASFVAALNASAKDLGTVHSTLEASGAGRRVEIRSESRLGLDDPATKMSMRMDGSDIELILVDEKIYVKGVPGVGDGTKWIVLDEQTDLARELASSANQFNPDRMYEDFDKAVTDVEHLGEETVEGESMNKYELTMDTSQIPGLPTEESVPDTLVYTAWLDERDRLRKVSFDLLGMQTVATMGRYGEPVDITAPPEGETMDLTP